MKRAKYLTVLFVGTLVYVLLSVIWGANGILATQHMEEQKTILRLNKISLQNTNQELSLEVNALTNDKTVIAAYARKLDYVSDGEKLLKITGLPKSEQPLYDAGTIIKHEEPVYLSEILIKTISLFLSLLTFILIFLFDLSAGNITFKKEEATVVKGIPIYDLQQI